MWQKPPNERTKPHFAGGSRRVAWAAICPPQARSTMNLAACAFSFPIRVRKKFLSRGKGVWYRGPCGLFGCAPLVSGVVPLRRESTSILKPAFWSPWTVLVFTRDSESWRGAKLGVKATIDGTRKCHC